MSELIPPDPRPVQHIHASEGRVAERVFCCADRDPDLVCVPTIADVVSVAEIMARHIKCALRDLEVEAVAKLLVHHHVGCVPVVDDLGRPIGMITKLDLVEQLVATQDRSDVPPAPRTAGEVMMPIAIALYERATIAHAAALMAHEDVHHLSIIDGEGRLIGIVTSLDIVRWLARNDGYLKSSTASRLPRLDLDAGR